MNAFTLQEMKKIANEAITPDKFNTTKLPIRHLEYLENKGYLYFNNYGGKVEFKLTAKGINALIENNLI